MASLFLHDFTVLDSALLDPQLGPIGESLHVSAVLSGELDDKGFILDFGPAKKILKRVVDDTLDHKLLVTALPAPGARLEMAGGCFYDAPAEALALVESLDAAGISRALEAACLKELPANVRGVRIQLRSEPRFEREANFRYTHGLRRHDGNCQRLFHGHRNPIEVWSGDSRVASAEAWLASEWENAHFAHEATVLNRQALDLPLGERRKALPGLAELEYTSPQGRFRGTVPAGRLVLFSTEPSIENIARLGHERLKATGLGSFRVVAYEGLNKGASYEA